MKIQQYAIRCGLGWFCHGSKKERTSKDGHPITPYVNMASLYDSLDIAKMNAPMCTHDVHICKVTFEVDEVETIIYKDKCERLIESFEDALVGFNKSERKRILGALNEG